jgi:hypothetical protein
MHRGQKRNVVARTNAHLLLHAPQHRSRCLPQAEPSTGTPHVGGRIYANVSRKTRPVRCPVKGGHTGTSAATPGTD